MLRSYVVAVVVIACTVHAPSAEAAQTFYPVKDGTLADGGSYGPFDGVADDWDWSFSESSYEGSILLTTELSNPLEHRVVWEYNLNTVSAAPPVLAELSVTVRGAPIWPFPDVDVHVYSYPADLQETPEDFGAGPTVLQGILTIIAYQDPTEYVLDVSAVVDEALTSGANMVAFRFQIDPGTPHPANQAFIDALDSDQTTKPFLVIDEAPLWGDADGDRDVDVADFQAFEDCMLGPDAVVGESCDVFRFDPDEDVDVHDFAGFQQAFTGPGT